MCLSCGAVWQLRCPRWLSCIYLVTGLLTMGVFGIAFIEWVVYRVWWKPVITDFSDERGANCLPCLTIPAILIGVSITIDSLRILFGKGKQDG